MGAGARGERSTSLLLGMFELRPEARLAAEGAGIGGRLRRVVPGAASEAHPDDLLAVRVRSSDEIGDCFSFVRAHAPYSSSPMPVMRHGQIRADRLRHADSARSELRNPQQAEDSRCFGAQGAGCSLALRRAVAASSAEMSERQRRWSWWVGKGAVAMAALAALSLALTVGLTQYTFDRAADVMIRGDGDSLVTSVLADLWDAAWPVSSEGLASVLAKHESQGLRYIALVDAKDHHVLAAAGGASIATTFDLPGEVARQGRRVRLIDALARLYARAAEQPERHLPQPRPYLVLEFEPPVIERLQSGLTRIWIVAGAAALVAIALAFAWSRTNARLTALQEQAERERRLVALGTASSVIAHELRNPLATLKGHAQLLIEDLAEPARGKAERVVEGAERLERVTAMLLDFVRDGPIDPLDVTPAELVDKALALAASAKEHLHVDLSHAPTTMC